MFALLIAGTAHAQRAAPPAEQPAPPAEQPAPPAEQPAPQVERPTLLADAVPTYPAAAWAEQREADVVVLLTVDPQGAVTDVELVEPAGHGFDESALVAARALRFTPARIDGAPVAVQIRYTFRFRVPEKATVASAPSPAACDDCAPPDTRTPARITVTVYERGLGTPLAGVEVYVLDEHRVVLTDADGKFTLEGPPGAYAFTIRPPAFYPYHATERVEAGEHLELEYYVRRHRRARYSTIVWGTEGRAQVARTSLADDEIRTVAGTMGDPIRVAMLLPGVSASVSGVGYPIVRGALPGDMLYEVDGIRVPMLYHLLFGPAVIHPRFVDQITFQPGGYSAEHGRFPGGKIGATTARVGDHPLWVADLSIIETSLLRSQKLGADRKGEVVAAARYGTLGYIIEGLASNTVFRYWDYQTRLGYWLPTGGKLTLTVLGAGDAAGESDPDTGEEDVLSLGFHTADLRYRHGFGAAWTVGGVQFSYEAIDPPADDEQDDDFRGSDMLSVRPYAEVGWAGVGGLELRFGGDLLYQDFGLQLTPDDDATFSEPADTGVTLGAWASAEWAIGKLRLHPSVRVDHYRYDGARTDRATAVDPRVSAAYQATDALALKAAAGVYSGPARMSFVEPPIVFGPVPAFEGLGLMRGLSRSYQTQAGIEARLPRDLELVATGFYHDIHSGIDFSVLDEPVGPDTTPCNGDDFDTLDPFDIDGSSYGAELMLRRRLGRSLYGWTSYAVSRSSRRISGRDVPFDFDQRHVLNTVLSWEVGRNWTLGGVFHFNTGNPYTPAVADACLGGFEPRRGATNSGRLPSYWRVDFRVQKREVFDTWYFDFYIDLFNALFQWETVGYDIDPNTGAQLPEEVPLFVPIIGIRGEF